MRRYSAFLPLFAALLLAGCGALPPVTESLPSVTGTIALRDPAARLPEGAILEIRIVDYTVAARPVVMVERADTNPGQPPLRFRVTYDPAAIDPVRDYSVEARIVVGGRSRWVQTRPVPVITKSRPVLIEVVLQAVTNGP